MDAQELGRIVRASRNGLILDSNLLIIYLVGLYRKELVKDFLPGKCLESDFDIIKWMVQRYRLQCVVTPQILAEVSNLTFDRFQNPLLRQYLDRVIGFVRASDEEYTHKNDLLDKYHLPKLGFADSSIIEASKNRGYLVVTEDFDLYGILLREHCPVININHLRTLALSNL